MSIAFMIALALALVAAAFASAITAVRGEDSRDVDHRREMGGSDQLRGQRGPFPVSRYASAGLTLPLAPCAGDKG
jgi:hypothetical protein